MLTLQKVQPGLYGADEVTTHHANRIPYIKSVYPAYCKQENVVKPIICDCGYCKQQIHRGDKVIKMLYTVWQTNKNFTYLLWWRLECYKSYWPTVRAIYNESQAMQEQSGLDEWFSKNTMQNKHLGKQNNPAGRPRVFTSEQLAIRRALQKEQSKLVKQLTGELTDLPIAKRLSEIMTTLDANELEARRTQRHIAVPVYVSSNIVPDIQVAEHIYWTDDEGRQVYQRLSKQTKDYLTTTYPQGSPLSLSLLRALREQEIVTSGDLFK